MLDTIKGDLTALQAKLGGAEKSRLDNHLQALRDVEARASGVVAPPTGGGMSGPTGPVAACDVSGFNKQGYRNEQSYYPQSYHKPENFPVVGQLQMDLAVLALSCNLSRVVTLDVVARGQPHQDPGRHHHRQPRFVPLRHQPRQRHRPAVHRQPALVHAAVRRVAADR